MLTLDPFGGEKFEVRDQHDVEAMRRELGVEINHHQRSREELALEYGSVWNTDEMSAEFTAVEFRAPFVIVERKSDNQLGTLLFQHGPPRLYFCFIPDTKG
jgi:hypothetical protein